MGIPPHAARLAGAWAVQTTRPAPGPAPAGVGQSRRDRSRRITTARLLHPLRRPIARSRNEAQSPLGTQPARHA
ncbi:hypothetical protein [Terrabacter sp. Ter38]|uniref:hypothetical protein n=1 Tax=Terrabacter sp. Ter38 TaxID=2926030 RepID=UPI002118AD56|nr:hypothetical protein [Terrabacter sp. Ter38]